MPVVRPLNVATGAEADDPLTRSALAIIGCDATGAITSWNEGAHRLYGWSDAEALGRDLHTLLATEFPAPRLEIDVQLGSEGRWDGELTRKNRNGAEVIVASYWSRGTDTGQVQIDVDLTARKQAEDAIRQSRECYRRLVDEDLTGNVIMRPNGDIVMCNPAFAQMFAFISVEEAGAANVLSLLRSRTEWAELIESVREEKTVERHELEMRRQDGEPVYVVARFIGRFDASGRLEEMQVYLFNDTKRRRLEQQLIQRQKMESLGTLAGGIAHDFNNILAIILGYTSRIEALIPQTDQIPAAAKVIKEAVERGAALVQQLLTAARQSEARFSSVDLNALVLESTQMLQSTFPKTIDFELRLHPNLALVTADRSQLHQVLLNLSVNARDAMPDGGSLTIQTTTAHAGEVAEHFSGADAEKYAVLRVTDTGNGMTREVKSHIFEPFFTTKERGKGTGLGLSVVYGVVNNHRGFVMAESEAGTGTTFTVYLPLETIEVKDRHENGLTPATTRRIPQLILLVEDEEMLRDLGVTIFEAEGYRVLAAKDGEEALELFEANRDEIGLVVCDLGLPKLGGREVFLKMKASRPAVRAIVASGYLEPGLRSEILKAGVLDTIQKPYDFREMVTKIRSIIGPPERAEEHPQLF